MAEIQIRKKNVLPVQQMKQKIVRKTYLDTYLRMWIYIFYCNFNKQTKKKESEGEKLFGVLSNHSKLKEDYP